MICKRIALPHWIAKHPLTCACTHCMYSIPRRGCSRSENDQVSDRSTWSKHLSARWSINVYLRICTCQTGPVNSSSSVVYHGKIFPYIYAAHCENDANSRRDSTFACQTLSWEACARLGSQFGKRSTSWLASHNISPCHKRRSTKSTQ